MASFKIEGFPHIPKGIEPKAWMKFITNICSNCETPEGECTDDVASYKQAKICFEVKR